MKLNEHNSKRLFGEAGLPVPDGVLLGPDHAPEAPFAPPWVLKSQVLSGGRGKAGGIRIVDSQDQARVELAKLFDLRIHDERVRLVRIEPKAEYTRNSTSPSA